MKGFETEMSSEVMNVVSLFGNEMMESSVVDPLESLIEEAQVDVTEEDFDLIIDIELEEEPRAVLTSAEFPDQSMYVLEEQLANLKESIGRIRFYLGDLEDVLPR